MREEHRRRVLTGAILSHQLRQLRDIHRDPPGLVFGEQLGGAKLLRLSGRVNRWQIQFRDLSSVYRQEFGSL
jgi:hypothetical protein